MTYDSKSSADLEREVEMQRNRVEARIGEIKDRLSPGQLLDEALSYTSNGGAEFASNLGRQLASNPLPAALAGVGIAWLIGATANGGRHSEPRYDDASDDDYPYARIPSGGLRRTSHSADETGQWWSEFETETGDRYRARATSTGERAGHFTDKAGKIFSGFIDDAGHRVRQIRDEAGNVLSEAQGWTSHGWRGLSHGIGSAIGGVGSAARHAMHGASSGGRHLAGSTDQLGRQITQLFDSQPLIAGALAFAAGAAVGAALPHTEEEDNLVGEQADKIKERASKTAGELYEKGKEQVPDLVEGAKQKAGEIYSDAKRKVSEGVASNGTSDFR
jgi:hypothetical protein